MLETSPNLAPRAKASACRALAKCFGAQQRSRGSGNFFSSADPCRRASSLCAAMLGETPSTDTAFESVERHARLYVTSASRPHRCRSSVGDDGPCQCPHVDAARPESTDLAARHASASVAHGDLHAFPNLWALDRVA